MRSVPVKSDKKPIRVANKNPQKKKKMSDLKPVVRDTISETISFVIKGKLTPIKPILIENKLHLIDKPNKKMQKCGKVIKHRKCKTNQKLDKHVVKKLKETPKEKIKVQTKTAKKTSAQVRKTPDKILVDVIQQTPKTTLRKNNKLVKPAKIIKKKPTVKIVKTKKESATKKTVIAKPKKIVKVESNKKKMEIKEIDSDKVNKQEEAPKSKVIPLKSKGTKIKMNAKVPKQIVPKIKKLPAKQAPKLKKVAIKKPPPEEKIIKLETTSPLPENPPDEVPLQELQVPSTSSKEIKTEPIDSVDKPVKTKPYKKLKTTPKMTLIKKRVIPKNNQNQSDDQKCKTKLFGFWNGPKRHRVASLNALAKVHCLYENEGKGNLLDLLEEQSRMEYLAKVESLKLARLAQMKREAEYDVERVEEPPSPPTRILRSVPGLRAVGKHWDMPESSSSSDESDHPVQIVKEETVECSQETGEEETIKKQRKRRRNRDEVIMDLKDMVVRKRMASLNASAILAASYSTEKRQTKVMKNDEDSSSYDSGSSEEYFAATSDHDIKEEVDVKKEDDRKLIEVHTTPNKKVAVILNQDTDVTITGVYVNSTTRSTRHEGYCSIAGMQYRISATSHTHQTAAAAAAVATETLLQSAAAAASSAGETQTNSESPVSTGSKPSYAPLDALSNMQPPPGPGVHQQHNHPVQHLPPPPPPPQHLTPPHHVLPIHQQHQLSPPGLRHGCSSAFSSPHSTPGYQIAPAHQIPGESGYIHAGYYQPAGPLITVPHGHGQPAPPPPPLAKSAPLSEASPVSTTPSVGSHEAPPPQPPSSNNGDSSDSEVIITSVTTAASTKDPPPGGSTHNPPAPYRYATHHQYGPPPGYSYAYPASPYHHYPAPPPPGPASYHELCYSPPGPYVHKYPAYASRRYLAAGAGYYPPAPPPTAVAQDLYSVPPQAGAQQNQQVVTTPPSSSASSYGSGGGVPPPQPPSALVDAYSAGPPPQAALVEAYQPPLPPPPHYYPPPPAYGPPPAPSCYTHSPASRAIPYINAAAYQTCPCPIQSCPKNGLTGPLTGDSKRSNLISKDSMPLPPVALALPLEPASATGPPSPARGSAGMPPPPSPAGATYQPPPAPPKRESLCPIVAVDEEDQCKNHAPVVDQKKRKARVGKAMVRNNIVAASMQHNTMLLMCNPPPQQQQQQLRSREQQDGVTQDFVKREIESPKEKEVIEQKKEMCSSDEETKPVTESLPNLCPDAVTQPKEPLAIVELKEELKEPEKEIVPVAEQEETSEPPLQPVINTVAENVKVKNMKRKLSMSKEKVPEPELSPTSKKKLKLSSYKSLIKKDTNVVKIHNGKRKLIDESPVLPVQTRRAKVRPAKPTTKRKLSMAKESISKKLKLSKPLTVNNFHTNPRQQQLQPAPAKNLEETVVSKKIGLSAAVAASKKPLPVNSKTAPALLDNLIAKNNVDRTIENVVNESRTPSAIKKCATKKCTASAVSAAPALDKAVVADQQTKVKSVYKKIVVNRRKPKCKDVVTLAVAVPQVISRLPRRSLQVPRWSNGWMWEGESYEAKVFVNSDELTVVRKCYPAMRHSEGDKIVPRDCVLLKAGPRKNDLPFVAKIAALWENPEDGEMMMSLLWYYRPEHTEQGRLPSDQPDEVFASRHKDSNSVACIDDKCYVLTFNEYCRYRKRYKRNEEGIEETLPCIPNPEPYPRLHRQPPASRISPDMVFFCRRVYDFRQKRIMKNPT